MKTHQLTRATIRADIAAYAVLKSFADYKPANNACLLANVQAAADAMASAQDERAQLRGKQRGARDSAISAEWAFHNMMLAVKEQVRAQYGSDSDQVQSVGLKKKSHRARHSKGTTTSAPDQTPEA